MALTGTERIEAEHAQFCVTGTPETCDMHRDRYLAAEEREKEARKDDKSADSPSSAKDSDGDNRRKG